MDHAALVQAEITAFMKSRVILTGVEFDIFSRLDKTPSTAADLAVSLHVNTRGLTRLLDCLTAMEYLMKDGQVYSTAAKGAVLSWHHPQTMLPSAQHQRHLWDHWSQLTAAVTRGGTPRETRDVADPARWLAFIGAMHVIGRQMSLDIAGAFDAGPYHRLLDIGGASGTYTIAFLDKNPQMSAVIFDLADVTPLAGERIAAEGLESRVEVVAGDFSRDELPRGCDLALLSAIIHQNSPDENLALYQKIFRALEPGGTVLIRDHVMDDFRTKPLAGTLFALNMLNGTPGGDTYTFGEIKDGLQRAGFTGVELIRIGEKMDSLVQAQKTA